MSADSSIHGCLKDDFVRDKFQIVIEALTIECTTCRIDVESGQYLCRGVV